MESILVVHGGAPTAVINASLYGAVRQTRRRGFRGRIYGAIHGTGGVLEERFADLGSSSEEALRRLLDTPASAIGTSRTPLEAEDYGRMAEILKKHQIRAVLMTGGNGTMDACGRLKAVCADEGISVCGIPKTIDNDIGVIDHAPGYGSAARFVAQCVSEIALDVRALPIHVCIVEVMGRNAGWLAAASALARREEGGAPDLIYVPEAAFDEEKFLSDVSALHAQKGDVVVVVSEGLKRPDGSTVAPPLFVSGRARYDGDVGNHLAKLVISRLGIKARSEKPGIWGRCCMAAQSPVDREEAVRMGALAADAALDGRSGVMAGLRRLSSDPYSCEEMLVPVEQVMLEERLLPPAFLSPAGNDVTKEFVAWCRPLAAYTPPDYASYF